LKETSTELKKGSTRLTGNCIKTAKYTRTTAEQEKYEEDRMNNSP
jgi:hypothetical protein